MEFDKNRILTCVTGSKELVGKKGWFADSINILKEKVVLEKPTELISFNKNNSYPFRNKQGYTSFLFYPAQEPTYAERQAQWIKENNVKEGTKVRVTRTFTEDEDGSWCCEHDDLVGMTGVVSKCNIDSYNLRVDMSAGKFKLVPYFALEVIKEPTYRPFKNAEEFKPYRDEWFVSKCDNSKSSSVNVQNYSNLGVILLREVTKNDDVVFDLCRWDEFFQWFVRENGDPCGVREEA